VLGICSVLFDSHRVSFYFSFITGFVTREFVGFVSN
jgi:hypothetical protein